MQWPTLVSVCDGYIGRLGDRFYMAVGAKVFNTEMNPIWPVDVPEWQSGYRSDHDELLALVGASPRGQSADSRPLVMAALVALVVTVFGVERHRRRTA